VHRRARYSVAMVTLTERAAAKIRQYMEEEPDGEAAVFRLAIRGGGCSGFQYDIGFDAGPEDDDVRLDQHGVVVVVDPASAPLLRGSQVDYVEGLMATGFQITNPNVASSCGCGTSFNAREDATAASA
jgi:iron-sulfur cluster assembly accessory protein